MVRLISTSLHRNALRCVPNIKPQSLPRQCQSVFRLQRSRTLHDEASNTPGSHDGSNISEPSNTLRDTYRDYFQNPSQGSRKQDFVAGQQVTVHGFIGKRKDMSPALSFCDIESRHGSLHLQVVSTWQEENSNQHHTHRVLKTIPAYSPVTVKGTLQESQREPPSSSLSKFSKIWDLQLDSIQCWNPFPKDIIVSKDAVWPPKSRHLQLRFDPLLRDRLRFRDRVRRIVEKTLHSHQFFQYETPVLFKSTPEGAREFLVPTRRRGYAYALPQSPQQYKQILMAGGVMRYFQFARCFRDEDHRADRQPEFTQLDLEMAFATGEDVMNMVENVMRRVFAFLYKLHIPTDINGIRHPVYTSDRSDVDTKDETQSSNRFPKYKYVVEGSITYITAITRFGTDKPDLRIRPLFASNIYRMDEDKKLTPEFIRMITKLENPMVQACKFRLNLSPRDAGAFIRKFMDLLPSTTIKLSETSTPAVFVYDSSQPLNGLSALGHEAAQSVEDMDTKYWPKCKDGDIIIMHARENEPFYGGSTELGRLRTAIHESAIQQGFIPKDYTFRQLWVHSFPLFTPNGDEPGQGGSAGFSSTHHPFTAPQTAKDFDMLKTNPLKAIADHYDLVINGVEVGGGSRRIHVAEVQEYIMRDILKMPDERVAEFSHLLDALRAGCPPHAGFALGFDRLLTVMLDLQSVKDVIAFPKSNKGEDLFVGSPAKITPEQQKTYHIFGASS
ncbi:tRNA synthetases class II-domain-containing protein [Hypomontagnella monticulosa]|nr:tRNA synthetases class II-domain-containing protein [Hypomontagnella monticulosa]